MVPETTVLISSSSASITTPSSSLSLTILPVTVPPLIATLPSASMEATRPLLIVTSPLTSTAPTVALSMERSLTSVTSLTLTFSSVLTLTTTFSAASFLILPTLTLSSKLIVTVLASSPITRRSYPETLVLLKSPQTGLLLSFTSAATPSPLIMVLLLSLETRTLPLTSILFRTVAVVLSSVVLYLPELFWLLMVSFNVPVPLPLLRIATIASSSSFAVLTSKRPLLEPSMRTLALSSSLFTSVFTYSATRFSPATAL